MKNMLLRGINWAENYIPVYILAIRIIHNIKISDAQLITIGVSDKLIQKACVLVNRTPSSDQLIPLCFYKHM